MLHSGGATAMLLGGVMEKEVLLAHGPIRILEHPLNEVAASLVSRRVHHVQKGGPRNRHDDLWGLGGKESDRTRWLGQSNAQGSARTAPLSW